MHEADRQGLLSLDDFLAIYGFPEPIESPWRRALVEQFHYVPRPDARGFEGERVFELGGCVRVRAIPAPGHTRGHCVLLVEPDGALYLGDIDLSSFGPYYGDAWSSLVDFERSLALVREIEASAWITFHHIGVIDDRATFLARLDRYAAVIRDREERLLAFLAEPHTPRGGRRAPLRLSPRRRRRVRGPGRAPQHGAAHRPAARAGPRRGGRAGPLSSAFA